MTPEELLIENLKSYQEKAQERSSRWNGTDITYADTTHNASAAFYGEYWAYNHSIEMISKAFGKIQAEHQKQLKEVFEETKQKAIDCYYDDDETGEDTDNLIRKITFESVKPK